MSRQLKALSFIEYMMATQCKQHRAARENKAAWHLHSTRPIDKISSLIRSTCLVSSKASSNLHRYSTRTHVCRVTKTIYWRYNDLTSLWPLTPAATSGFCRRAPRWRLVEDDLLLTNNLSPSHYFHLQYKEGASFLAKYWQWNSLVSIIIYGTLGWVVGCERV